MDIRKIQGHRLARARRDAGFRSARDAALSNGWVESSYRAHENGTRTIGQDDAEKYAKRFRVAGVNISGRFILYGDEFVDLVPSPSNTIPVLGRIGAGAEIYPEVEQVPPEGLFEIELPFDAPHDARAFEVEGDSMWPAYSAGDVILCGAQVADASAVIGQEAAVQTVDGRRYLKTVHRASNAGSFDLESHNAPLMRNVRLEWAAEVDLVVKRGKWRRLAARTTR